MNLPKHAVTNVGSSKILLRYISPFRVPRCMGNAYILILLRRMRNHPMFYAGCAYTPNHRVTDELRDATVPRAGPTLELGQAFPPPPQHLVESRGDHRFLVERILNNYDEKVERMKYLVRWRGDPSPWDRWEPHAQLTADVQALVNHYDETHSMIPKGDHRKTSSPNGRKRIRRHQSRRTSRPRCATTIKADEGGTPP